MFIFTSNLIQYYGDGSLYTKSKKQRTPLNKYQHVRNVQTFLTPLIYSVLLIFILASLVIFTHLTKSGKHWDILGVFSAPPCKDILLSIA